MLVNMLFDDYVFKTSYNSDENDIAAEFYIPALKRTNLYKRAAGFFSSSCFLVISPGIEYLLYNNGKMQLLTSPHLSSEDIEAIYSGYANRKDIIYDSLVRDFKIDELNNMTCGNFLAWLIYEERLDIKVVVRKDFSDFGIFHDKYGILYDNEGNNVAFRGSINESETAYLDNYEAIEVFLSWEPRDQLRIRKMERNFNHIWYNYSTHWETFEFPEAIKQQILTLRTNQRPSPFITHPKGRINISNKIIARDYQKDAVLAWLDKGCKGILEMATGTGKTITAIYAMNNIYQQYVLRKIPLMVLITVPYKVLLEQWVELLVDCGIIPIPCYESRVKWFNRFSDSIKLLNKRRLDNLFIVTTNTTFKSKLFQELLSGIETDILYIADEVHHLTTDDALKALPRNARYRLGLTATLMDRYSDSGIAKLLTYFESGVVYRFPLADAIQKGFLTPYYYYPIFVELTDEEKDTYFELSNKIGQLIAQEKDLEDDTLKGLLIRRARLIASCENKLLVLRQMKDQVCKESYCLFYCGDIKENNTRYVEMVNQILAYDFGMKTHTFTADETSLTRKKILKEFEEGRIQALTAIRCLDEGVDIPKLQTAYILSSGTNPKEFIQRRGRILRRSPGKKYASIYDFIVVPSLTLEGIQLLSQSERMAEQKIILREFERFKEFADLAINKHHAYQKIMNVWSLYERG